MDAAIHQVAVGGYNGAGTKGNELLVEEVKDPRPNSSFGSLGRYVEVRPVSEDGAFERSIVTIHYEEDDLGWVDAATIRVFRFDDERDTFDLVQDSGVDVEKRFGHAWVDRPGIYGLIGLPSDSGLLATLHAFAGIEATLPEGIDLTTFRPKICQLILCNGFQVAGGLPAPGGIGGTACEICLGLDFPVGGIVERPLLPRPRVLPWPPDPAPAPADVAGCSLQNGQIVFVSDRFGNSDIWVMNADGSGETALTANDGQNNWPAWSPDGARIAFTSDRAGSEDIWLMDADGGNPAPLTDDPGADHHPSWSPDGRKIVFSSDRAGTQQDIWFMNADGSNETRLTTENSRDREPSWSPDCTLIAFVSDRDGRDDIWTIKVDGGDPRQLTKGAGNNRLPAWSPAGDRIAFMSDRTGNNEIWHMKRDGSELTLAVANPAGDVAPHWAPDGRKIVFASDRDGNEDIWVTDTDGNPVPLTRNPGVDTAPDWQRVCRVRLPKCGVSFGPASRHDVGVSPVAMATARLRGAGHPLDLVTVNAGSDSISVLLGDGAGGFAPAVEYPTNGTMPQHLVIDEFTHDGVLDIVVTNQEPGQPAGTVSFFLGRGDGTFYDAVVFDAHGPAPNGLVAVDLNRDGWMDVALTYMGNDAVGALLNDLPNGNNTPVFPGMVWAGGSGPRRGVAAMDFNSNGMIDGAVVLSGSNGVGLFVDPSAQAAGSLFVPVGARPMAIVAARFTRSGTFDMATANHAGNSVSIVLGRGDGSFSVRGYPTGRQPIDLATLNLDPAGALDLVTADQGGVGSISLLANDGNGAFERVAVYDIGAVPSAVVTGDFNGDGKPDVAVTSALSDAVLVLSNTT